MKQTLTLGRQLMLGVTTVMIPISSLVLIAWFALLNPMFEDSFFQIVRRGTIAETNVIAQRYAFEIAAPITQKIKNSLKAELKKHSNSVAYILLDDNRRPKIKVSSDTNIDLETIYKEALATDKEYSYIAGEYVVAQVPVKTEEIVRGYLIQIRSIKKCRKSQLAISLLMTGLLVVSFLGMFFGIALIGRRAAKPIADIAVFAQRIADGNLQKLEGKRKIVGSAEVTQLAGAVYDIAEALRGQVISIKELIDDASLMSKEVSGATSQLATSASEQAAAVTETAATVEEMEKNGQSASTKAHQIVEMADKTTEASIRGRQAVDTTSNIIFKIKDDSKQISARSKVLLSSVEEIGNVIGSVNSIAEQSKILAVNASIEAAKAGEYGVGFVVVAQEVKDLAQQSKEATEQITRTLITIRKAIEGMVSLASSGERRTEEGVHMVSNAGAIVNDLSEAIKENSNVANVISTSVNQQTLGLSQIATAISQINISATENQKISRQIEKSTKIVTTSLEKLSKLVDGWRVNDNEKSIGG